MARFEDLPREIQRQIYSLLDVPSICRAYVAFAPHPCVGPAANCLQTRVVAVSLDATERCPYKVTFDVLAQLPPCDVKVTTTVKMWRLTAHQLNQVEVKSLDVTISGDGIYRDNGKWFEKEMQNLKHPINNLEVINVTFDASYISEGIGSLTAKDCLIYNMRSLATDASLQRLRIENCQINGFYLPQTLTDVTLINASSDNVSWQLPNLRNVEVDSHYDNLPWNQVEELTIYNSMPNYSRLDNVRDLKIKKLNSWLQFEGVYCPNLKKLELDRDHSLELLEVFEDNDVSNLLEASQKRGITELLAVDYSVSNLDHFQSLRIVEMSLYEPMTDQLKLPQTLEKLTLCTSEPVTGIPEQIKEFILWSNMIDVSISSSGLREADLINVRNASIHCPQLVSLSVHVADKLELDTPKVKGAHVSLANYADNAHILELPGVSSVTLKKCAIDSLRFGRILESLDIHNCEINDVEVEAIRVLVKRSVIHNSTNIVADDVEFENTALGRRNNTSVKCRELYTSGTPLLDSELNHGIERLMVSSPWKKQSSRRPGHVLGCRAFAGCSTLQRLTIVGVFIDCTKSALSLSQRQ
ncbi:hypothetical protein DIURU_001408 [Diutina rugosa]|uniref:Uncharacterized protein n=1 Tax=Diutina rugosa TaxID=5481 RepID=A0A642V0Y0_DIURU|nr:uncharacterized protein DIURU_001408 [Diutina rugosa]KAA8905605.1 hypothetical protein DIURU_001408 [Diutina rugosa]